MTKTEALKRARAQLRHGYYQPRAGEVYVYCPVERSHRVTREVVAWLNDVQRVAVLRDALVEHLTEEHALDDVARDHAPVNWLVSNHHPWCTCGFGPDDNAALNAHWAALGIAWHDDHGQLTWERVVASA